MQNTFGAFILVLLLTFPVFGQAPQLLDGWPYGRQTELYNMTCNPRFSSLDSSAIYFNTLAGDIDKFHFDGSFYQGWPNQPHGQRFSGTPIVVDIDHDGRLEIVTSNTSYLYIIDDDGSLMPGYPLAFPNFSRPSVADFDNDGEYEIILYSRRTYEIQCLDRFGNLEPGWPQDIPEDTWVSANIAGSVGDLDNDGYQEIIIKGLGNLYAYRYDGSRQTGFPIPTINPVYGYNQWFAPALVDIDQDGLPEILVSAMSDPFPTCSSYVAIYENDGQLKPGWPLVFPDDVYPWQMPIPADINGDGLLEIGFALTDGYTYFVDINGNNIPGWPVQFHSPDGDPRAPMSDIIAVDIDGDNDCEIFCDYNRGFWDPDNQVKFSYFFGIDHLGNELPGFPIRVKGSYLFRPPTFFLGADNHLLMGICTENSFENDTIDSVYLEVYRFPDSTGPADQWPMPEHDNLMTRNYNFVDHVTAIDEGEEPLPKTYVLKQNYPNPFNASTKIEFDLPKVEPVSIAVYDILGREVERLVDTELQAGHHEVIWQADRYASGMYFYVMRTPRTQLSRKIVLLK